MRKFLLLYCRYDPDNYSGHRISNIEAESLEDAKEQAYDLFEKAWVKTNWEFRLVEIGGEGHDSGYRAWDTRPDGNELEVNYTITHYWIGPIVTPYDDYTRENLEHGGM